jgi:hypothetical protein
MVTYKKLFYISSMLNRAFQSQDIEIYIEWSSLLKISMNN